MGLRICRWLHTDPPYNHGLYIWPLSAAFAVDSYAVLLPSRPIIRSRQHTATWTEERTLQPGGRLGQGRAGIWLLLGRCDPGLCAGLGVPLRCAVPVHATDRHTSLVSVQASVGTTCADMTRPSLLLSNTLYLAALNYYFIITFLGYKELPFLHHTELLLVPVAVMAILWFASLFGFNMSTHFAPVLWTGAKLRKHV
jgi:hypothetical protein